jgi:hypothetical protein
MKKIVLVIGALLVVTSVIFASLFNSFKVFEKSSFCATYKCKYKSTENLSDTVASNDFYSRNYGISSLSNVKLSLGYSKNTGNVDSVIVFVTSENISKDVRKMVSKLFGSITGKEEFYPFNACLSGDTEPKTFTGKKTITVECHVSTEAMLDLAEQMTGKRPPAFVQLVIHE